LESNSAHNTIQEIREGLLMSRAELARKAGVSLSTINRVEKGENCRQETKRKLIVALGYDLSEKDKVFPKSNDG
jgi:DNA-binding XRE family transcriptional regulator